MHKKHNKNRQTHGKNRTKTPGVNYKPALQLSTFRKTLYPSQLRIQLSQLYMKDLTVASNVLVDRYNPNSVYQPSVSGPTATVPMFSEIALVYGFYRVMAYDYDLQLSNKNTTTSIVGYVLHSNNDPTTSATLVLAANPLSKQKIMSAKGGMDTVRMKGHVGIADVVGTTGVATADGYRALINASPADVTWMGVGVQTTDGSNLSPGVAMQLKIYFYVEFYDRLLQT